MKRSTKLLIAGFAIWSILLSTACNGPQNMNVGTNQPPRQDNNGNSNANTTPMPGVATDAACNPNSPPATRRAAVQGVIDDKISHDQDLNQQKIAGAFSDLVVIFPKPDPSGPESQALALVIGGSMEGPTVFPKLMPIIQPVMAQKCVLRVIFVPLSMMKDLKTDTVLTALPDGFGWSGCDYPAVACPDGSCATQCPGGIKQSMAADAGASANTAQKTNSNTQVGNKH